MGGVPNQKDKNINIGRLIITKVLEMEVKHFNGTVGTEKREIRLPREIFYFYIAETSGNTLYYSFDGTHFTTVPANAYRSFRAFSDKPIEVDRFYVKASAVDTDFEIIVLA